MSAKEKKIYFYFRLGIILKLISAIGQIAAGIFLLVMNPNSITQLIFKITKKELLEDPNDYLSTQLLELGHHYSLSVKVLFVTYLLVHGFVKLYLLHELWKERHYAYIVSIIVFGIFFLYQVYKYMQLHSIWLLLICLFDIAYIWLLVHEYRYRVLKR
jgi:uncharacterized membrane protein